MKVLIVEDSPEVVETIKLCISIRWPGAATVHTRLGGEAAILAESEAPDIVILDLGLPDSDGLDALKEIRLFSHVPVLILSARGDEISRVKGLELGADDYITKPFSHTEFLARMKAIVRRTTRPELWGDEGMVSSGPFTIDFARRQVLRDGESIRLTPTEWHLLSFLARNPKKVIPTEVLAERVWGSDSVGSPAVRMCVRRLRVKLGDDSFSPFIILTHRGMGYSFEKPA